MLRRQAGVFRDGAHGYRVDRRVPRYDEPNLAVAHYNLAALAGDTVSELLENPHGVVLANSRDAGHRLDEHFSLLHALQTCFLSLHLEPKADRVLDVRQRLFARLPLRVTAGKVRAADRPAFIGLKQVYLEMHGKRLGAQSRE